MRAGPVAAFWFLFWHDLWANNAELGPFADAAALLDPAAPGALAYAPTARAQLETVLADAGLGGWVKTAEVRALSIKDEDARCDGEA